MAFLALRAVNIFPKLTTGVSRWSSVRSIHSLTRQAFSQHGSMGKGSRSMSIAVEDDGDPHTAHVIMPSILDSKEGTVCQMPHELMSYYLR